jgi:hypothetical protein
MFILDTMLVGSLRFVFDQIIAAAEAEAHDDTPLREQLLEAQMRLEIGELSEEEFAEIERDLLARIREIKGGRDVVTIVSPDVRITGVEASVADEVEAAAEAPQLESPQVASSRVTSSPARREATKHRKGATRPDVAGRKSQRARRAGTRRKSHAAS